MSFAPNWTSAPGNTILDILEEKEISVNAFAKKIKKEEEFVINLIEGKISIDYDLAYNLQNVLGFTTNFWIQRDNLYQSRTQSLNEEWVKKLPLREMIQNGFISKNVNIIEACLSFFGVTNLSEWNRNYGNVINELSFRKSNTFDTDPYSVAVWLRNAERLTSKYKVAKWDKTLFEAKLLSEVKPLTRKKDPRIFLPQLAKICAGCGVKLAISPAIGKNRASGATKLLDEDTALIILSFRYLTDDHFWFTFFHEAGHLIMHSNNKLRIEFEKSSNYDIEEQEANLFAEECLLPSTLHEEMYLLKSNTKKIVSFSMKANVSPGIVIGQMQHKKIISFNYLNSFKRKYNWDDIKTGVQNMSLS